ncbi:MAG: ribosome recycling factor [Candidatus Paceibacterota bacterium]|jgi:ribosome recycling factor
MAELIPVLENETKLLLDSLKQELSGVRGNRPTPKLVEDIKVDYLEQKLSIKQLASIGILLPSTIEINVWDRNSVASISKAVETANLGVSVNVDSNRIRVVLPPLSEERRIEIAKIVKKEAEKSKIHLRTLRDEFNKKVTVQFDNKEISEDEKFKLKEKIQKTTDETNKEIENISENKIKEIYT